MREFKIEMLGECVHKQWIWALQLKIESWLITQFSLSFNSMLFALDRTVVLIYQVVPPCPTKEMGHLA